MDGLQLPTLIAIVGSTTLTIACILIAPASILPMEPTVIVAQMMMGLLGAGLGIVLNTALVRAFKAVKVNGFHLNKSNSCFISGTCESFYSFKNLVCRDKVLQ